MEFRVDQLAAAAEVSVDTIRFYQSRGLLPTPRREGRVAWYGDDHLARLGRIRSLQQRGFTLAAIRRFLDGELDAGDEALVAAVAADTDAGPHRAGSDGDDDGAELTIEELAARSGIPVELLRSLEREHVLVPRPGAGAAYSEADVVAARAGLRLLEHGLPVTELLALARDHHAAVRVTAERAVELFDAHVRRPLRESGVPDDEAAARLVAAFADVLPATVALVAHHFRRTLLAVAQEHIERVGDDAERNAVAAHREAG